MGRLKTKLHPFLLKQMYKLLIIYYQNKDTLSKLLMIEIKALNKALGFEQKRVYLSKFRAI